MFSRGGTVNSSIELIINCQTIGNKRLKYATSAEPTNQPHRNVHQRGIYLAFSDADLS